MTFYRHTSGQVTDRRISPLDVPVVVIDPEDAEQVKRLDDLLARFIEGPEVPDYEGTEGATRAALREFANPTPRIEEPQGRYAVVVDRNGDEWIRDGLIADRANTGAWWCAQRALRSDPEPRRADWADIHAVRVLSPGVTSEEAS